MQIITCYEFIILNNILNLRNVSLIKYLSIVLLKNIHPRCLANWWVNPDSLMSNVFD